MSLNNTESVQPGDQSATSRSSPVRPSVRPTDGQRERRGDLFLDKRYVDRWMGHCLPTCLPTSASDDCRPIELLKEMASSSMWRCALEGQSLRTDGEEGRHVRHVGQPESDECLQVFVSSGESTRVSVVCRSGSLTSVTLLRNTRHLLRSVPSSAQYRTQLYAQ